MHNRSVMITLGLVAMASGVGQAQIVRQIPSNNTAYGTTAVDLGLTYSLRRH